MNILRPILRCRFFLVLILCLRSAGALAQTTFYVSPSGGGTNFSPAQPGALFDARDAVRALSTNMTGDIVVYLFGGTYALTNSFQLRENSTSHDSGAGGFNVIYEAYPGQTPIISGGLPLTNWSLFNPATNIWRTFVGVGINSRQFYVNGVRAIRARGPLNPAGFNLNSAATGFTTTNLAMQNWGNPANIEIVQRHNWKQLRCPIASIIGTNIVMQTPCWTYSGVTPSPGRPWNGNGKVSLTGISWVENAYELLASPGMWYLDQAAGWLYYIPRPGENLTNGAVAVLPVVEKLIDAQGGSLTMPIHNIVLSGITFEYATWLLPSTSVGYADNQTSILWSGPTNAQKTLAAVSFQTAANIQITNCLFLHLGGSAIDFGGGAHTNLIIGNDIEDISSDGISVGEVTDYATTDPSQMTDGNVIQDNFIRRPGQEYEDAIGIWIGYSRNTIVAHNDVDNAPYTGISLGWGWGTPTYSANNRVIGNYVGKVMQTLTDGGSVYSLSAQTNSWHIGNYYKDSCYQGIYWDEGSEWWTAVSNAFDNCIHNYINLNSSSTNTTGGVLNNQNNTATNNFSNVTSASNPATKGVNDVIASTTFVTSQFWPPNAQAIILDAGLEPAFAWLKSPFRLVNENEPYFDHVPGDWTYASARNLGEYHNDVHYTQTDGQYVQYTFTAAGITWIGDMNADESNVVVYLDGNLQATVNCFSATRETQVALFSATNLAPGPHALQLVKNGGAYMILDALAVTPTNFWLTATPNSAALNAGNSFSNVVRSELFDGYSGAIALSVSGLPANASASFSPSQLPGAGFSVMTVTTASNTPGGSYELTIAGTGGGVTNIAMAGLTISGGVDLRWDSTTSAAWDTTSTNWLNLGSGKTGAFQSGDDVLFDDTSGVATNVTIAAGVTVQPGVMTVTANTNEFSFNGAGAIGGAASLVKSGLGTMTLNTTNSFTGGVTVSGGTLKVGSASALGSASGITVVTNGGTLDISGFNLTTEPVTVAGAGLNGNGAIVNSGSNQISALRQVSLTGNAIFGGNGRWDIRAASDSSTNGCFLSTGGRPYKITKLGANQVSLVAVSVDPALGDIDIEQGMFAIQTATSQLGNPTNTITIYGGATLNIWALGAGPLNKKIVMQDGAILYNASGTSTNAGTISLQGNDMFNIGGTALLCANTISGPGSLTKTGSGILYLSAASGYGGSTTIVSGTLALTNGGAIGSSTNLNLTAGTVLDVSGRSDGALTLAAGQTLSGRGTINGNLTENFNATINPGASNALGALNVTGAATLQGATAIKLNRASLTNDVIEAGSVIYGGTLEVTNMSGTLQSGDAFKVFTATNYTGTFANIQPPTPGAGLAWNANGLTHGVLGVSAISSPNIDSVAWWGTNLTLSGATGPPGASFSVLATTNVIQPVSDWSLIGAGWFDDGGGFSFTNYNASILPQQFYLLRIP